MGRKNRFRWGLGLLAAGLLAFGWPLVISASERNKVEAAAGTGNTSDNAVIPRVGETDKSGGLVCAWLSDVPKEETVFTAGGGTITWTPELQDGKVVSGTLILKDAEINNSGGMGINFPVPVDIRVEGSNQITSKSMGIYLADRATGNPLDLKITGSGSLKIDSQSDGIQTSSDITVDTASLEVRYGSSSTGNSRGLLTTKGNIEIRNSSSVKVKSNSGVQNEGSAISAGQNSGTVRIVNSHVIAITEQGSAINANGGKIELVSSDVRAIGKTYSGGVSGTLSYSQFMMDGGTLYADNKGDEHEIPLFPVSEHRVNTKNGAVLYGAHSDKVLPLEGDCVWYVGCAYEEDTDEVTISGNGYLFGEVEWNENMYLGAGETLRIGSYSTKDSSLTVPKGMTVDMPAGSKINVVENYYDSSIKNSFVINGTLNIENGAEVLNKASGTFVINGTLNIKSGAEVLNTASGTFVNHGVLDIQEGGQFQNQYRVENSGTVQITGTFSNVLLTGYNGVIADDGIMNGFIIEMYDDRYVNVANGKTVLKAGIRLNLGDGVAGAGKKSRALKVLDGAELTVEKGAIIDAKTNVTMDTVSDYIDLSDTIVVNGELWLPENTPEEVLAEMADKVIGDGSIVTGITKKYIITVDVGGEVKAQFVGQGGAVDLAAEPVRDGYRFNGWYVKNGGVLEPFDLETPVQQSMEIVSKWIGINKWITPITMETWTYGETAHEPEAEPRFGEAYYRYGSTEDGTFTDTVPSEAGTWYVKAFVDGTEEYTSLESAATSFRIEPKAYREGGSIVISAVSNAETVKNLVIKDGDRVLVKDRDYTVATAENGNTVTVTVTFLGNYGGTAVREYQVSTEEPSEPEDPGQKPTEPKPEDPGQKPTEPKPEDPGQKPAEPEPEKPAEKPAKPQEDVERNTILLNNKIKAVFSGAKIKVTWGRVSGAKGYDVYAAQCGKPIKLVKSVKGSKSTSYTFSKIGKKKISTKEDYKIKVRAYRTVNGKKQTIGSSLTLHIAGKNKKSYTNARSIKVSSSKLTVKKGASKKIKARTVKQNAKKRLFPKKHVAPYRYYSTNKKVASVSAGGTVKGKKKGTCTVYVVAANGVKKGVKVTVK